MVGTADVSHCEDDDLKMRLFNESCSHLSTNPVVIYGLMSQALYINVGCHVVTVNYQTFNYNLIFMSRFDDAMPSLNLAKSKEQ